MLATRVIIHLREAATIHSAQVLTLGGIEFASRHVDGGSEGRLSTSNDVGRDVQP